MDALRLCVNDSYRAWAQNALLSKTKAILQPDFAKTTETIRVKCSAQHVHFVNSLFLLLRAARPTSLAC